MSPRKPRSGRRQFPAIGGTPQEWEQVMASPHVQRAMADPQIQQALVHNLHSHLPGAAPPEEPKRFQAGGFNATRAVAIQQKLDDPNTPESEKMALRTEQAQLLQQSQSPGAIGLPGGQTISSNTMAGLSSMAGKPPTMGNTAAAVGVGALMGLGTTRQQGLSALVGAGTAGLLNYLIRKYGKAKQPQDQSGGGGSGGGQDQTGGAMPHAASESTGAVTEVPAAEAWKKNQPQTTAPSAASGPTGGPESVPGLPNVGALPPSMATPGSGPPGGLRMGSANSQSGTVISYDGGKTWVDQQTHKPFENAGAVANQTQIDPGSSLVSATPATTPPPVPSGLGAADTSTGANSLGPAFTADQQKRLDAGLIRRGPAGAYAPGWDDKLGRNTAGPDLYNLPMQDNSSMDLALQPGGFGLAEGGPVPPAEPPRGLKSVLVRKPLGMPVPVLHTTIVIAAKPKDAKKGKDKKAKQAGGVLLPAKPQLLPPRDHEDRPRPHGRVQVPRGSGAAIKGKRFGGIY